MLQLHFETENSKVLNYYVVVVENILNEQSSVLG